MYTQRRYPTGQRRPCPARAAAFMMLIVLGGVSALGRCVPSPGGARPDAGAPSPDAAATAAELIKAELGAEVKARLKPLEDVRRVHLIGLSGPLDDKNVAALSKGLAGIPAGEAVVVELDAAGGTVGAVERAQKLLADAKPFTVAYVRGRALGEAAILPLACRVVALAPGASWGALSPSQFSGARLSPADEERLWKAFTAAAKRHGRSRAWAAAMVRLPGGPAPGAMQPAPASMQPAGTTKLAAPAAGRLVTLTPGRAQALGLADLVASDAIQLVGRLGLAKAEVLRAGKKIVVAASATRTALKRRNIDPKKVVRGAKRIVLIGVRGTIELGLHSFVVRALEKTGPTDLVVLEIDTFGGRVDAATQIRDALLRSKAKTVALINPRAISAGALISLACDLIVMVPGGSFGAATPIQISGGKATAVGEKMVSYMRKEMKTTAEAKGRRGDLAEAMVDMSIEVKNVPEELMESISGLKAGKLLTLTTQEAMALDMAEMTALSFDDFVRRVELQNVPVIRPTENWAEKISRFLTGPIVSGLLMTLGMLGLLIELYKPGFGVAGGIGLTCLLLFFFGHKISGLAGWEPMLLFLVGVVLLGVELFVTPGFGALGSLGILAVIGSMIWTLMGPGGVPLTISWKAGYITSALVRVFGAVIVVGVLMALLLRFLPKGDGPLGRLVLSATVSGDATAGAHVLPAEVATREALVGLEGVAETALRPTGKARIRGKRLEVVSGGEFIDQGAKVRVVSVEGRRILVQEVSS
ncbi:MAG: NfeD family protein [bacterium]